MDASTQKLSMRERVLAVFDGKKPDRIPFICRIEFWYKNRIRTGTMPEEFKGMSETEVHRAVGVGQEKWRLPYAYKYHGVEAIATFEGEEYYHEVDPELDYFPAVWDLIPEDKVGTTVVEYITPVGKLSIHHSMVESMVLGGTRSYQQKRPVVEEADYRIFEYIIEHAEYIPRYEQFFAEEAQLGEHAYLIPNIERIPFQMLLLDVIGEEKLFYALYDYPNSVERLLEVMDGQFTDRLQRLADFPVPYVEFVDNLDGFMTNPNLFEKYSLPVYQRYTEVLHGQNKRVGSHADGDLKSLLHLLPESGLDICESFTPAPITQLTFEEAWEAWKEGPIIWGGIPSYYLEERVAEDTFQAHIDSLLDRIGSRPIILGVADAVMSDSSMDRVRAIVDKVDDHAL